MQWNKKEPKTRTPNDRETRIVTRFLFFPTEHNGVVKWLTFARIKQIYYKLEIKPTGGFDLFGQPGFNMTGGKWYDEGWADPE